MSSSEGQLGDWVQLDVGAAGRVAALFRSGPRPLVFIHGFAASGAFFADAMGRAELAERGLLVIDLPGYGRSHPPSGYGFSMAEQAATIASVIEALSLEGVTLVGHSMGGTIALLVALSLGEPIEELFAVEAILQHEPTAWTTRIAEGSIADWHDELERLKAKPRIFARGSMLRRSSVAIDRVAPSILETTTEGTYLSAVSLRDTAADPSLYARFLGMARTTYVFGDRNLDVALYERLLDDGASIAVVPRAGHLMMFDNPDAFYGVIARGIPGHESQ